MKGMSITRNPLNFNKHQFLNRETQFETGLIDLKNRQYNPQTGRFTSQDPIIDGQEHLSLYQYGWNNPVLQSDADGLYPCCGDFLNGVGNGFVGTFQAIGNAIAHPINTFNNAAQSNAAAMKADPVGTVLNQSISSNIGLAPIHEAYQFGKAVVSGDSYGAGHMAGGKLAEATIVVATEGAGRAVGAVGKAGTSEVGLTKNISSNVQKVLNTIDDLKKGGGEVKTNPLNAANKQELNMTFKNTHGSKLDLRIETHEVPKNLGGNGTTPQRHLNATVTNSGGNIVKMKHIQGGHKLLE